MTRVVSLDSINNDLDDMMDDPSVGDTESSQVFGEIDSNSMLTVHPGNNVEVVMNMKHSTVDDGPAVLLKHVVVD